MLSNFFLLAEVSKTKIRLDFHHYCFGFFCRLYSLICSHVLKLAEGVGGKDVQKYSSVPVGEINLQNEENFYSVKLRAEIIQVSKINQKEE